MTIVLCFNMTLFSYCSCIFLCDCFLRDYTAERRARFYIWEGKEHACGCWASSAPLGCVDFLLVPSSDASGSIQCYYLATGWTTWAKLLLLLTGLYRRQEWSIAPIQHYISHSSCWYYFWPLLEWFAPVSSKAVVRKTKKFQFLIKNKTDSYYRLIVCPVPPLGYTIYKRQMYRLHFGVRRVLSAQPAFTRLLEIARLKNRLLPQSRTCHAKQGYFPFLRERPI